MDDFTAFLNSIAGYGSLFSFFVAVIALIYSFYNNRRNDKKDAEKSRIAEERYKEQKEQYEKQLAEERQRREEDKFLAEERARISEKPYLVVKEAKTTEVIPSSLGDDDQIIFSMTFINKGRGAAYSIIPDSECEVVIMGKPSFKVYHHGAVEDPIALVREPFSLEWSYIGKETYNYRMNFSIKYQDASGRNYKQDYKVDIIDKDTINIISFAVPELI